AASRIDQQFAGLKDPVAVPRFRGVGEHIPLHSNERNIQIVEEGNRRQAPAEIGIQENKIAADRAAPISAMIGEGVAAKQVCTPILDAEHEVIVNWKATASRTASHSPIEKRTCVAR